jgi:hypothetical protein
VWVRLCLPCSCSPRRSRRRHSAAQAAAPVATTAAQATSHRLRPAAAAATNGRYRQGRPLPGPERSPALAQRAGLYFVAPCPHPHHLPSGFGTKMTLYCPPPAEVMLIIRPGLPSKTVSLATRRTR